ncbi:site-specific DNA-methyltransferase [Marinilactibacillus psychrotolerans]|uniref:DNA-methyltransferase n=1 Tax=Marinilactibacillus psychrotolerans TaxID=191770 RepID=UPI0038850828
MELNKVYNEDCLEGMKRIPDKNIDMILCDLPYGTTACKWDTIIPFEPLWEQYTRIIKDNGAIVLTASQPFTSALVMSNPKMFKEELIWEKHKPSNFGASKSRHMKYHESVLVFSKKRHTYNPQMIKRESERMGQMHKADYVIVTGKSEVSNNSIGKTSAHKYNAEFKLPSSTLKIPAVANNSHEKTKHPTQKPVALFEYLIKTYTNENETVLDNCMGSGTTAIATINTNRKYVGFESDKEYYKLANERIKEHLEIIN